MQYVGLVCLSRGFAVFSLFSRRFAKFSHVEHFVCSVTKCATENNFMAADSVQKNHFFLRLTKVHTLDLITNHLDNGNKLHRWTYF